MALLTLPIFDYSDKDFASLRLRLQGLARSVFPDWTDFNAANFGNLLTELFSFVGDNLTFYQDAQARELYWPTVTRRISAIRLGRLINFMLSGAAPAVGTVKITVDPLPILPVNVPPGTRFKSVDPLDPIPYRSTNTSTLVISTFSGILDVPVEQTELVQSELFESTGAPNQEFLLARIPYVDGSTEIIAGDGVYIEIESLVEVQVSDLRRFVVLVDQNDRAHIRFGNGTLGSIPQGTITVNYKITRGAKGNVEAGKIQTITDTLLNTSGDPVSGVSVTNILQTEGGADRMSVARARSLGPASLRILTRSITRADFETHAQTLTSVARATMVTSNEDVAIQENEGLLLIVAVGERLESGRRAPATAQQVLLDEVKKLFGLLPGGTNVKPPPLTFRLDVQAATFKQIAVSMRIFLKQGAVPATVKTDITNALKDFFAVSLEDGTPNPAVDFGVNILNAAGLPIAEIAWSDVFDAVRDVDGIRKIDEGAMGFLLNGSRQSVLFGLREFPALSGTPTIVDADTGNPL